MSAPPPICVCGHPIYVHAATRAGRITYCTVWNPTECPCKKYEEKEPE